LPHKEDTLTSWVLGCCGFVREARLERGGEAVGSITVKVFLNSTACSRWLHERVGFRKIQNSF
jgi:hypothetical protein